MVAMSVDEHSFNPCFNGCRSEASSAAETESAGECFNPCFNGCRSEAHVFSCPDLVLFLVSILVLMDVGLKPKDLAHMVCDAVFVSILVLMDVGLKQLQKI